MYLSVAFMDGYLLCFVEWNDAERSSSEVVIAGIADRTDDILLQTLHMHLLLQPSEHAQQHLLHHIFCILPDADSHIGKTEEPVLPLHDNPL